MAISSYSSAHHESPELKIGPIKVENSNKGSVLYERYDKIFSLAITYFGLGLRIRIIDVFARQFSKTRRPIRRQLSEKMAKNALNLV